MQKREICQECTYPKATCLCDTVACNDAPVPIFLLQDKWEAKHAKNTGKLVKLCLKNTTLINVDKEKDALLALEQTCLCEHNHPLLIFPSDTAVSLDTFKQDGRMNVSHLIFIDTTWRKATRMLALYPWLAQLKTIKIEDYGLSQYQIRKSRDDKGISTIEAVQSTLKQLYSYESESLTKSFAAFKTNWQRYLD